MGFPLVETRWLKESLTEDSYRVLSYCSRRITQFWLHGFGTVRLELVWIGCNTLATIGSEESVVDDSYQVLNWLEDMSIFAGFGTEWLEQVETG